MFLMICNFKNFQSQLVGVERDKVSFPLITMSLRLSVMSISQVESESNATFYKNMIKTLH